VSAVFESFAGGIRKIVAVSSGWLPKPPMVILSGEDRHKVIGRFRAEDGRNFEVISTDIGFRIDGLTSRELIPIDNQTFYDTGDPEAIVRFKRLRNRVYTGFAVTHPLRLTINARRV